MGFGYPSEFNGLLVRDIQGFGHKLWGFSDNLSVFSLRFVGPIGLLKKRSKIDST
jgi:hypothetical protein